jgi:hypothetical protein
MILTRWVQLIKLNKKNDFLLKIKSIKAKMSV